MGLYYYTLRVIQKFLMCYGNVRWDHGGTGRIRHVQIILNVHPFLYFVRFCEV